MQAISVTTTAAEVIPAGNRDFVHIMNNSDEVIYFKFDGSATALTTANGFPIVAGGFLILNNDGHRNVFDKAIWAIHGGTGSKEIRVQGA